MGHGRRGKRQECWRSGQVARQGEGEESGGCRGRAE